MTPRQAVGIALKRLRFGVTVCCWIVGVALGAQIIIWSLVAWTDLREPAEAAAPFTGPMIVDNAGAAEEELVALPPPPPIETTQTDADADASADIAATAPPQTFWDRMFATAWKLAAGFGKLMMLLMLPLILVGVLLGAGSATPGIEKTVSAFGWGLCVGLLVLPIGHALGLPWGVGALTSYADILAAVEESTMIMYAKHLLLPAACIAGVTLVGLRFSAGVEAALPEPEHVFDPQLERETSGMKATSLHGGRGTGALQSALKDEIKSPAVRAATAAREPAEPPKPSPDPPARTPRANEVSPGQPMRRLI